MAEAVVSSEFVIIPWMTSGPVLQDTDGNDIMAFDMASSEDHSLTISVSRNPVEDGVDITDHSQEEPVILTLSVVFTDTPLGGQQTVQDRARKMYQDFLALALAKQPLQVVTGLDVYPSMLIESVSVPRDGTTGYQVTMSITFAEAVFVDQLYTKIPERILNDSVKKKGQGEVDKGTQALLDLPLVDGCQVLNQSDIDPITLWCVGCRQVSVEFVANNRGDFIEKESPLWSICPENTKRYKEMNSF